MISVVERVWRLVKSELAATSAIRLAKISDRFDREEYPSRKCKIDSRK